MGLHFYVKAELDLKEVILTSNINLNSKYVRSQDGLSRSNSTTLWCVLVPTSVVIIRLYNVYHSNIYGVDSTSQGCM